MGEQRPGQDQERLLTLAEAAEFLGISKDGVRMRVRRGTLRSEKGEDGRVYVYVSDRDATQDTPEPQGRVEGSQAELVEVLREQVEDLRARLDRETEANRENRRIIAGLIERVPELESSTTQPRESPLPEQEGQTIPTPGEPRPGPQEASERPQERSWWRRIFR